MRQFGSQSRAWKRLITFVMAFAMIITSLAVSSTDSAAKAKVKKITIGVKVGGSGILVLKKGQSKNLAVSVSPKKASKKVTYKSSNKKVVKVNKKGVVKALKASGSAKITVTSKQDKKKKATITVKCGTPISKITVNDSAQVKWTSANYELVENGKNPDGTIQYKKVNPTYTEKIKAKKGVFTVMATKTVTLKTTIAPAKATRKSLKWSVSSKKYANIVPSGSSANVIPMSKGAGKTITVTAQATDGSGKKTSTKIKITEFVSDKTPAPTAVPDTRMTTMIDDFESYEVGKVWDRFTAGGYANSGHMTVVADPEDPNNKVLEIKYDGTDQAFDFCPVLSVDLEKLKDKDGNSAAGKTLGSYSGVKLNARIVGTAGSNTNYKTIYVYFDKAGAITAADKCCANANQSGSAHVDKDGNKVEPGAANEDKTLRFGLENSMAEGTKTEAGITLWGGKESKESNRYFPFTYESGWKPEDKSTHYSANSCTAGYKPSEPYQLDGKDVIVGFATRSLTIDQGRIKELDATLPNDKKFDMVIGSTYDGQPAYNDAGGGSVTLYLDDIMFVEESVPVTKLTVSGADEMNQDTNAKFTVAYEPENTTQKEVLWTVTTDEANKDNVTIDTEGNVVVKKSYVFQKNEAGEKLNGKFTVTATSKDNKEVTASKEVTVKYAAAAQDITLDIKALYDNAIAAGIGEVEDFQQVVDGEGVDCFKIVFTGNNQRVFFKLPETINLNLYKAVEIVGNVPGQMVFDGYSADVDKVNDEKYYEKYMFASYPFYMGSRGERNSDADLVYDAATMPESYKEYVNDAGIIPKGSPLGDLSKEKLTINLDSGTLHAGYDLSKLSYMGLGSNKPPVKPYFFKSDDMDPEDKIAEYYIYSIKLIAKTDDDVVSGDAVSGDAVSGAAVQ